MPRKRNQVHKALLLGGSSHPQNCSPPQAGSHLFLDHSSSKGDYLYRPRSVILMDGDSDISGALTAASQHPTLHHHHQTAFVFPGFSCINHGISSPFSQERNKVTNLHDTDGWPHNPNISQGPTVSGFLILHFTRPEERVSHGKGPV